ncbi:hypothetical protein AMAG_11782 [Allomyces macrogynus ATCC 38327]|uniref:Uncharacterized protein n=1 Tax=Allomyces macrogynus (strain ATCC 38327) TaxID=578462 RepID=A0A0L0SVX2_ALLM3|nr:hypothetical protein AMAG_11782 [Allomyces macrogynus ATCC 38327]|eukprot:KNE66667.1 hypothetical protein AMAG_11782 [Allomyces macrogynus ATCC 38327]
MSLATAAPDAQSAPGPALPAAPTDATTNETVPAPPAPVSAAYRAQLTALTALLDQMGVTAAPLESAVLATAVADHVPDHPLENDDVCALAARVVARAVSRAVVAGATQSATQGGMSLNLDPKNLAAMRAAVAGEVASFLRASLVERAGHDAVDATKGETDGKKKYSSVDETTQTETTPAAAAPTTTTTDAADSADAAKKHHVGALTPEHALPIYFVSRAAVVKYLWPKSDMEALNAHLATLHAPDAKSTPKDRARSEAIVSHMGDRVETVLSHVYAAVTVQITLLSVYGGSVELLQWLDEDEDTSSTASETDAVASPVKKDAVAAPSAGAAKSVEVSATNSPK